MRAISCKKLRRLDGNAMLKESFKTLDVPVNIKDQPDALIYDLPTELLDEIASHIAQCPPEGRLSAQRTLSSLSLVSHRFTAPAQHALVRHLVLGEPARMDALTRTFYTKKGLGRSVRSLELKIGPSDVPGDLHATSAGRRALELALIGLLPFIGQSVRDVSVAASYDCPSNLLSLLTEQLKDVRSFSLASAFGYSKLVYVGTGSIAKLLTAWPRLTHLSMTMPWVIDDGQRRRPPVTSSLRSLEISGFRGELLDLQWLLASVSKSLTRLAFDCPLDQEPWDQLGPALAGLKDTLTDLSLWSWTYEMPIRDILRHCPRLRHVALAAHDCAPELYAILPKRLESLLICSHREFSPLDTADVAKHLDAHKHLHALPRLTLYDPSAQGERFEQLRDDEAWSKARQRGCNVQVTPDPRILGCHIHLPDATSRRPT